MKRWTTISGLVLVACGGPLLPDETTTPTPAHGVTQTPAPEVSATLLEPTPTPGAIPAPDDYKGFREATNARCGNLVDDDIDGRIDCDDDACKHTSSVTVCGASSSAESSNEACSNGQDDDDDGYRDCADFNCQWNADVTICDRDADGQSYAQGDCFDHPRLDWSFTVGTSLPEMCGDGEDNDCDGTAEERDCLKLDLGLRRVSVVNDGDTIQVDGLGPVRFKGIDTPESYDPPGVECYGAEAKAFNEGIVADQVVRIVLDPVDYETDFKDYYDRWLAHIYLVDGSYHNAAIVAGGYACVWETYLCSTKVELLDLQSAAQNQSLGLWESCGESVCF